MSQWDKLLNKITSLSGDIRFDEIKKILENYGYEGKSPSGGSSHCTFRKSGCNPITVPRHEPIKKTYVEMVKKVVEEETTNEKNS